MVHCGERNGEAETGGGQSEQNMDRFEGRVKVRIGGADQNWSDPQELDSVGGEIRLS